MHVRAGGEGALVVALEDVEGGARDEVVVGREGDVVRAIAFVGDSAVKEGGGGGGDGGYRELEPDGEGDAEDVEAGALGKVLGGVEEEEGWR